MIGILAELRGGAGGNQIDANSSSSAGAGGAGGSLTAVNQGDVSFTGIFSGGLSLLTVQSLGGNGGAVTASGTNSAGQPQYNGGVGGLGGNGGAIVLTNTASFTGLSGNGNATGALYGIRALSRGGNAGSGQLSEFGGNSDQVTVNHTGGLTIGWGAQPPADSAPLDAYAIVAQSLGGDASNSYLQSRDGADGGMSGGFFLNLTAGTNVSLNGSGNINAATVGGVSRGGRGGDAYSGEEGADSFGGAGGFAGTGGYSFSDQGTPTTAEGSLVLVTDALVTAAGDLVAALSAIHEGGAGGQGADDQQHSNGGIGGDTAKITALITSASSNAKISSSGNNAPAIFLKNEAGAGGSGQLFSEALGGEAGNGGAGGSAGSVTLTVTGATTVSTSGSTQSPGMVAQSLGGAGGSGGELSSNSQGGGAGLAAAGGDGGSVEVDLDGGSVVTTAGTQSPAVFARSVGGVGGAGGTLSADIAGNAPNGGSGGDAGGVNVNLFPNARAATAGDDSSVLVGQSVSGGGGAGGAREGGAAGNAGQGGSGGSTGEINISNSGSIQSSGDNSHGILAQAISGVGGSGGNSSVVFYGSGGNGAASGSLGTIQLSNGGSIVTSGDNSHGYLAQSLAGGGGAGGNSELGFVSLGGNNPVVSNAGPVFASNGAVIATSGDGSHGALLQSVGGGGGDGGSSAGLIAIGGQGGGGGAGGAITADFGTGSSVTTQGDLAVGILAQSVGGGGGNGGEATVETAGAALVIGGSGGSGGGAGAVAVTSGSNITTTGTKAIGILGQSVGGGGGNGGAAYALDVSLQVSAAVAVGGRGGAGGNGGEVNITLNGGTIATGQFTPPATPTNLLPVDAFGIVAQSIGMGGGNGGSATAGAITIGLPVPPDGANVTATTSIALGGAGGGGGNGGNVTVLLDPGTNVITQGQGSHGILAQSIGGGGGNGGDSSASSATVNYSLAAAKSKTSTFGIQVDVAMGGSGGVASDGGEVQLSIGDGSGTTVPASIVTYGDFSNGLLAQSIGGGGGNAGVGSGNTQSFGTKTSQTTTLTLGSTGGAGGDGGTVNVLTQPNGSIVTYGDGSHGLVAQSVGGGGGSSQGGTLSLGFSFPLKLPPDGSGKPSFIKPRLSAGLNFTAGASGGSGGNGGSEVNVEHNGLIQTQGNDAIGILMQNIGGGGGVVGSSGAEASADNPLVPVPPGSVSVLRKFESKYLNGFSVVVKLNPEVTLKLGSDTGGSSGFANNAELVLNGTVATRGDWSQGVVVQGIGGGGGKAGSAAYTGSGAVMNLTQTLGSANGPPTGTFDNSGGQVSLSANERANHYGRLLCLRRVAAKHRWRRRSGCRRLRRRQRRCRHDSGEDHRREHGHEQRERQ